jgi:hypothetical protein
VGFVGEATLLWGCFEYLPYLGLLLLLPMTLMGLRNYLLYAQLCWGVAPAFLGVRPLGSNPRGPALLRHWDLNPSGEGAVPLLLALLALLLGLWPTYPLALLESAGAQPELRWLSEAGSPEALLAALGPFSASWRATLSGQTSRFSGDPQLRRDMTPYSRNELTAPDGSVDFVRGTLIRKGVNTYQYDRVNYPTVAQKVEGAMAQFGREMAAAKHGGGFPRNPGNFSNLIFKLYLKWQRPRHQPGPPPSPESPGGVAAHRETAADLVESPGGVAADPVAAVSDGAPTAPLGPQPGVLQLVTGVGDWFYAHVGQYFYTADVGLTPLGTTVATVVGATAVVGVSS